MGASMSRGGAKKEGGTESETGSRLWGVSTEPDTGLEITELWDHDLSWSWMLNRLSHPRIPISLFSFFEDEKVAAVVVFWLLLPTLELKCHMPLTISFHKIFILPFLFLLGCSERYLIAPFSCLDCDYFIQAVDPFWAFFMYWFELWKKKMKLKNHVIRKNKRHPLIGRGGWVS